MDMSQIGIRIKERRTFLGLTQTKINLETGISSGNLSDFEHGNKLPSAPSLYLLSKVLKCSSDWLLTGHDFHESEDNFSTCQDTRCSKILDMFSCLEEFDKNEVYQIVKMKYSRVKGDSKSYPSDHAKIETEIA